MMTLAEKCAPGKAAVLVVDMQNDYCATEGASGRRGDVSRAQAIVPALQSLIDGAREAGVPVIFIRMLINDWVNSPARLEQRSVSKHIYYCLEGTWGFDWYGVAPLPDEAIVTKHRYSAFIGTDLDLILRAQKIETIICTGVVTNGCVESTARDGFMMDYHVVFVDDSSATSSPETHEGTLQNIRGGFGVVVNAADIRETWAPAPVPAMA